MFCKLLLDAFHVLFGTGVNLNAVTCINKQWNPNFDATVEGSWFHGVGGCVAFQARLGVVHFRLNVNGQFSRKNNLIVGIHHYEASHSVGQELRRIDQVLRNWNLLIAIIVHEVVALLIVVEVLVLSCFDAHRVNLRTCVEGVINHTPGVNALEFRTNESRTLSRFYVEKLNDLLEVVVVTDAQPVANICCCCHGVLCKRSQKYKNRLNAGNAPCDLLKG